MRIRSAIANMGIYKPPLEGRNPKEYLLMDFNESPEPPPPSVGRALQDYLVEGNLHVYPHYGSFCEELGQYVGVSAAQLLLTNGSDQGIDVILRSMLDPGTNLVIAIPGFTMFKQTVDTIGADFIGVPYPADFAFPYEKVRQAVNLNTRVIVVINPNNPTGTSAPLEQVEALLKEFPDCAVLVDEAYYEFTGQTCLHLLNQYPNLVVLRTFSKAFAIPALRLGYVVAKEEFINELLKIRGPYDVNMAAIVAARALLQDPQPWKELVRHLMKEVKPTLENFFQENEIKFYPGEANFMLVEPKGGAGLAVNYLKDQGILVRPMRPPLEKCFRINMRSIGETEKFMSVFKSYQQRKD
ncbi:MAG TPA: class I/II aminotransferase [Deltaproteobacteria bacterium]|nr:class I/II aminotransferase [Deltaproteobacteria bacterium]